MNNAKIAAIYEAVSYPSLMLLMATGDLDNLAPYNRLAWRVGIILADENARMTRPNGYTYGISFKNIDDDTVRFDAQGERMYDERINLSLRAYNWASAQIQEPADYKVAAQAVRATGQDVHTAFLMKYAPSASTAKSEGKLLYAAEADLAVLLRGCRAFQRKQGNAVKKVLAQLAAYHQKQVEIKAAKTLAQLRRGQWLGAGLALTTAPRVNEPGVPFLGDATLTPEQLHYWAVPEGASMNASFPAGTGIALKPITSSKRLIDGAVYLYQRTFGKQGDDNYNNIMLLARLNNAKKRHGMLPLFQDDRPDAHLLAHACWKNDPAKNYEVKLFQVVAYTTRAEQLEPVMVAETQTARPALRSGKKRALQAAA